MGERVDAVRITKCPEIGWITEGLRGTLELVAPE